jgi:LmbE family N-acetylglucosaminyl deacetylase
MIEPSRGAIVFVVAHPDDVAFWMGGTALLLSERYSLHVICASRGERGYPWKGQGPPPPDPEVGRVREAEERECCARLGATLDFLDAIDGEIYAERPVVERVAALITQWKPVALFTHGPLAKADHAATYGIALQALHRAGRFWETEMYLSIQPGESYSARFADLYVNIGEVVERKRELVACHRSHHREPGSVEHWIEENARLGRMAWCEYAEAYLTSLPLMARRWKRKAGSILLELER